MRGLSGDFSTMPLKDLVAYLGNRRASGVLRVVRGEVQRNVHLREGHVVRAASNQVREFFGQFLVNMGYLTQEQFERALSTQRETKILPGKILVMTGLVTEEAVRNALSMKCRETLLDAFRWEEGEFLFDASQAPTGVDGMDVSVDLMDVHREGEFRETAWQALRAAFPSGRLRLTVDEARLPQASQPGILDARLVPLIREGKTLDEMGHALRVWDFVLYQRLYALYRMEAVRVLEEPVGGVIGTESSADEIIHAAQSFLASGNFRDGEALARRAQELQPSPATAELFKSAQAALLGSLRQALLERPQVPMLLVPATHLKTAQLSAPERYLLSRIDGRKDLATIIHASPINELDALRFFQGFVDNGLVRLTPR